MGAWEEIVDYTVPSNTSRVDFTGLNITKNDFIKLVATRTNNGPNQPTDVIQVNDNTSSNYHRQILQAFESSLFPARTADVGLNLSGSIPNGTGSSFSYLKISENNKVNMFTNIFYDNGPTLSVQKIYTTTTFDASPITKLSWFQASGPDPIGAGSRIQIYRLAAEKVADIVVSSNTTQVDITGLDIQKGSEYLLVSDVDNALSNFTQISLTPNDLTTLSNYYYQVVAAFGSSTYAERANIPRFIFVGGNTKSIGYNHIKLSNIGAFTHQSYTMTEYGTSSVSIGNEFSSSVSENITNINKLNIISSVSNAIKAGSRFQLYKLY
jgi:hypothetical protein